MYIVCLAICTLELLQFGKIAPYSLKSGHLLDTFGCIYHSIHTNSGRGDRVPGERDERSLIGLSDGFFLCLFPTAVWPTVEFEVVGTLRGSYRTHYWITTTYGHSCTSFTYTVARSY